MSAETIIVILTVVATLVGGLFWVARLELRVSRLQAQHTELVKIFGAADKEHYEQLATLEQNWPKGRIALTRLKGKIEQVERTIQSQ